MPTIEELNEEIGSLEDDLFKLRDELKEAQDEALRLRDVMATAEDEIDDATRSLTETSATLLRER